MRQRAEKLAGSLKEMYCDHWNGAYCEICAAEKIAAYAESEAALAREQERDACIKLVCPDCRCGKPLTTDGDLNLRHYILDENGYTKILTSHCKAEKLHERGKG